MKISPQAKRVHLPEVVGKGYGTFWNFKGRYRVCKGSRASKKSKTTALNIIKRMMQYPEANTLVVRKVFRTLKDSCFTELKWAINRLGVSAYWEIKESPLEMTYLPTGQKIYLSLIHILTGLGLKQSWPKRSNIAAMMWNRQWKCGYGGRKMNLMPKCHL